jgi:hypothetical protein
MLFQLNWNGLLSQILLILKNEAKCFSGTIFLNPYNLLGPNTILLHEIFIYQFPKASHKIDVFRLCENMNSEQPFLRIT